MPRDSIAPTATAMSGASTSRIDAIADTASASPPAPLSSDGASDNDNTPEPSSPAKSPTAVAANDDDRNDDDSNDDDSNDDDSNDDAVQHVDDDLARLLAYPALREPAHRARVERRLKHKLDLRCSLFMLIYIMNYLDRNNMAAARLKGLQDDLGLDDTQYATCLSILYVGYILLQVPSNMLINRISRPSVYIACAMVLWGLVSTLTGCVTGFGSMVATRFLLGVVEAAFLPGALLVQSKWYTKRELALRNALLFAGNLISNAFSALVAAGVLSNMQGTLGHPAWRWLFWIEGSATMLVAIFAAFILPDLPTNTRGFTEEELLVARLRIIEDVGEADKDSAEQRIFDGFLMVVKDPKAYLMMFSLMAYVTGLSFNAFFPTLTGTLGFGYVATLLMSAPPWVFACLISLATAWHSDYRQEKFWHIATPMSMGLVGFVISMATLNKAARYVALFLQAGSYAGYVVFYSWISSSFPRPPAKRAVALAIINAFSQLGNVAGSYVWDMPDDGYRRSYGVVTAMYGVALALMWAFRTLLVRLNEHIARGEGVAWEAHADVAAETARVEDLAGAGEGAATAREEVNAGSGARARTGFRYLV